MQLAHKAHRVFKDPLVILDLKAFKDLQVGLAGLDLLGGLDGRVPQVAQVLVDQTHKFNITAQVHWQVVLTLLGMAQLLKVPT